MRCYIFDIDGTLADCSHRLHYIHPRPAKDWRAFFAACSDDKPIEHIIDLAKRLSDYAPIVLVSGRSDECLVATELWLKRWGVPYDALYMRRSGDRRNDDILKSVMLDAVKVDGWDPIMAFDDRDRVVAMWRARGIPCAQVAPGNF